MDLEHKAIERLKTASEMSLTFYEAPLIITTSGGKDSDVCLELAKRAEIPYEVMHNHTTADAPQTIYHIREQFRRLELKGIKCTVTPPRYKGRPVSMWTLIPQKLMMPTRLSRFCCEILKEGGGRGRMITTGVRWGESFSRKGRGIYETINANRDRKIILSNDNDDTRRLFENCRMKAKRVCNPIIDWETRDVWGFLRSERMETNPLYKCGFERVGCVGCPMAGNGRYFEFRIFPQYEKMYKHACARTFAARKAAGKPCEGQWSTPEGMWSWWMEDKNLDGQLGFEDYNDGRESP